MGAKRSKEELLEKYDAEEVQPEDVKSWRGEIISLIALSLKPVITKELNKHSTSSLGLIVIIVSMVLTYLYGFTFQNAGVVKFAYTSSLTFALLLVGKEKWQKSQKKMSTGLPSTSRKKVRAISKASKSKSVAKPKRRSSNKH